VLCGDTANHRAYAQAEQRPTQEATATTTAVIAAMAVAAAKMAATTGMPATVMAMPGLGRHWCQCEDGCQRSGT